MNKLENLRVKFISFKVQVRLAYSTQYKFQYTGFTWHPD